MTETRPFDPTLFRDAASDPDAAKLNAQMVQLLADQLEWWIVRGRGFSGRAPGRRRPVPGPGDVELGADSDDHRQGPQRNPLRVIAPAQPRGIHFYLHGSG
jgi:hypothetical protein